MKKIFVLLALMLPMCAISNAEEIVSLEGLSEPTWESFAPSTYVDVEEPRGIGKLNETAGYWYNRRVEFQNGIEECRNVEDIDLKLACYQELKVKQYQLNSEYNAKIEAQEQARMQPVEMQNRTDNMLPLGGYLNNFTRFQPNELH